MLEPVDGAVLNLESLVLHAEGLYAQGATAIGDEPVGQDRVLAMEAVAREHAERRRLGLDAWALASRRGRAKDGGPLVTTPDPAIDAFRLRLDVAVGGEVPPLDDNALSVLDGDAAAANAPRHFHGDGSEGFSLSFGDLPAGAPSEHGVGGGLRLAFLTRLGRLVAKYADTELHAGPLPNADSFGGGGADVPILVERRAGRGLTLGVGNATPLERATVDGWAPQPGWRIGFGARNHRYGERVYVRNVEFEHGSVVDAARLPVEVSFNGQQYSGDGREIVYHASPKLSSAAPAGGPVHGGSAVLVRGGGLHGGTEYLCRFGPLVVAATFHAASETVVCVSPPWEGDVSTVAHLRVALNGQDYTEPLPFSYHEHPQILDHTPRAGPTLGNTTVTLLVGPLGVLSAGDAPTSFTAGVLDDGAAAGSFAAGTVGAALLRGAECRSAWPSPTDGGGAYGESDEYAREGGPDGLGAQSEAYAPTVGAVREIGGGEGLARAANVGLARVGAATEQGPGHYAFYTAVGRRTNERRALGRRSTRRRALQVPPPLDDGAGDGGRGGAHGGGGGGAPLCLSGGRRRRDAGLHVSFNGHDFRRVGSANWTFLRAADGGAVAPPTGPAEGGSRVVVERRGFGVGAVPFSAADDAAAGVGGVLIPMRAPLEPRQRS